MKLSNRLLACASLVRPGELVADVGTDHGHLPVYLLEQGICTHVIAGDLREGPLSAAKASAALAGVQEHITFRLSDGLKNIPMDGVDTVICAGMGGDTIRDILSDARQWWKPSLRFILQPQAAVPELRGFLGAQGFRILREVMARDGGFVYTVMEVSYGDGTPLTPGQCYFPQGQVDRGDLLYAAYMARIREGLQKTVAGIRRGKQVDEARLRYYESALAELSELEAAYENSK